MLTSIAAESTGYPEMCLQILSQTKPVNEKSGICHDQKSVSSPNRFFISPRIGCFSARYLNLSLDV